MILNKDVGFNKHTGELMINGETHELASPEALDALAVDVGSNTTAIEGLDARVTALEEGGASKVYTQIAFGSVSSGAAPGTYSRINVDVNEYDDFILIIKKQSDSIYSSIYINRVPLFDGGFELSDGIYNIKKWSESDLRIGVKCTEGGTIDYILYGR